MIPKLGLKDDASDRDVITTLVNKAVDKEVTAEPAEDAHLEWLTPHERKALRAEQERRRELSAGE